MVSSAALNEIVEVIQKRRGFIALAAMAGTLVELRVF
jgi:hypothetical protein